MASLTNYARNLLVDALLRGQALSAPSTFYVGLFSAMPTASAGGTELVGTGYARVAITCSLANWSGTQGTGTTAVSSGTTGMTSNNVALQFPLMLANWPQAVGAGLFDALTVGKLWIFSALATPQTFNLGGLAPGFPAGSLTFQPDS